MRGAIVTRRGRGIAFGLGAFSKIWCLPLVLVSLLLGRMGVGVGFDDDVPTDVPAQITMRLVPHGGLRRCVSVFE